MKKTQLKLASVAVAVAALVLNTYAVSLATSFSPSTDEELAHLAMLNHFLNPGNIPEAVLWNGAPTPGVELQAAVDQLTGSTVPAYYLPATHTALSGAEQLRLASMTIIPEADLAWKQTDEHPALASGEQVLLGVGSPDHMVNDLAAGPWVARATDLSGSETAVAAAPVYPSWFVNNPDLAHLNGLADYYPGLADYLARLNEQQSVASKLPTNVSGVGRV